MARKMEAKFEPLDKKGEKIDNNIDEIFQKEKKSQIHPFLPQKDWRNFGIFECRSSWRETEKI